MQISLQVFLEAKHNPEKESHLFEKKRKTIQDLNFSLSFIHSTYVITQLHTQAKLSFFLRKAW